MNAGDSRGTASDSVVSQPQESEWVHLWTTLHQDSDQDPTLFRHWIHPHGPEVFRGKRVLDAGCGGGHHAAFVAGFADHVVAVDRSTSLVARRRLDQHKNVEVREADIATVTADDLGGSFDVVYSIGVIHHTADPDRTIANLKRLVAPGGLLIVWVYSEEGNGVARYLVEPARKTLFRRLPGPALNACAWGLTVPALAAMHTIYRLPVGRLLPMYHYLSFSRSLTPRRVAGNVLDKLVAPRTDFISKARAQGWLADPQFEAVHFSPFLGVSWRLSARRRSG